MTVSEQISTLSDLELRQAIREITEDGERGIVREGGYVRKFQSEMIFETMSDSPVNITHVIFKLYREAAERFSR